MPKFTSRAENLAGAIQRIMEQSAAEAEGDIPPVVLTRLKRSVVASLAFVEEAVARGHAELREASPNAVTVQVAGRVAVAVLQGAGVLPQFHVIDGRGLDVGQLADAVTRAEALRQALVDRARQLGVSDGAVAYDVGEAGEGECASDVEQAGGRAKGGGGPGAAGRGVVTTPHLNGPKIEVLAESSVSRETQEGGENG